MRPRVNFRKRLKARVSEVLVGGAVNLLATLLALYVAAAIITGDPNVTPKVRAAFRAWVAYWGLLPVDPDVKWQEKRAEWLVEGHQVVASDSFTNEIMIAWKPVPGARYYAVKRSITPDGPEVQVHYDNSAVTDAVDQGKDMDGYTIELEPGRAYYYHVLYYLNNSVPHGVDEVAEGKISVP